eukprot:6330875-Alexandrium_andersonii.AAC.1
MGSAWAGGQGRLDLDLRLVLDPEAPREVPARPPSGPEEHLACALVWERLGARSVDLAHRPG